MNYPNPHPNPHVVEWAGWLPYSIEDVPDDLVELWAAAWAHDGIVDALMYGEWPCCRELPPGRTRPPSWLGHRDLCPSQWGDPCDCDQPRRTTPCVCRYDVREVFSATADVDEAGNYQPKLHPPRRESRFTINPRCVHHGQAAYGPFGGQRISAIWVDEATAYVRPCSCGGLSINPDCRRHNYDPTEDGPDPRHDEPPNPYDLEDDERHD